MPAGEMLIADVMSVLSDKTLTVKAILARIGATGVTTRAAMMDRSGVTPRAIRYALTHLIETGKARRTSTHGYYCAMDVIARVGVHSNKAYG